MKTISHWHLCSTESDILPLLKELPATEGENMQHPAAPGWAAGCWPRGRRAERFAVQLIHPVVPRGTAYPCSAAEPQSDSKYALLFP